MNTLLRSIGYPEEGDFNPPSGEIDQEAFSIAEQNKIASLYVASYESESTPASFAKQINRWKQHPVKRTETINRFYENIDQSNDFILVKSRYGFPADCSDIDILVDSPQAVDEIVTWLPDDEYEILGLAPTASTVRDIKTDQLVDIQTDFGLHNIIYFDDNIIIDNKEQAEEFEESVLSAHRGADIALHINHSITELMFTLKEYYTTVYFLETCSDEEFQTMVNAVKANRTGYGASVFFGLVVAITKAMFDRTPARKEELVANFGLETIEFERLRENDYEMPHKYGIDTLLRYSASRFRQPVFVKSMGKQMLEMLDPRTAYYFTSKFYDRATRDHYMR